MTQQINRLSAIAIKTLPPGKHSDGGGLRLVHRDNGSKAWVLRFSVHGRRREMGLGPYPDVSLKQARDMATEARQLAKRGVDPITARNQATAQAVRDLHRLNDCALDCFEAKKTELKGDGVAWFLPLANHVLPKLGNVPVAELDQTAIRDVLASIWQSKPAVALKAANRLAIVIRHAAALGLTVDLQAVDRAKLLLGKQSHQITHISAIPWADVPAFYATLGDSMTELALRLLILTGSRSGPIRLATADQFDLEAAIWTIPAENMKGRKGAGAAFRCPLSPEAVAVVREALQHGIAYLFGGVAGNPQARRTMGAFMSKTVAAAPHGFRSSMRSWAADTGQHWETAETQLGHAVGGVVERTYQRSDLIEKRTVLVAQWAAHVTRSQASNVVQIGAQK